MNPLQVLGAAIVADVNALLSAQGRGVPLPPLPDDDHLQAAPTIAAAARRRTDAATPLLAAIENPDIPVGLPVHGIPTGEFGWRTHPTLHRRRLHEGLDIAAPAGTPIVATAAGVVVHAGGAGTYGNLVRIDHAGGFETRYAHMQAIAVHVGDQVERGQVIGTVGSTGRSTGPHVHFEVRENGQPRNPRGRRREQ